MDLHDIRRRAQVGKDRDPVWYRIHRRLSIHVTRLLLPTSVRPDHVSLAMMLLWLTGVACVAAPPAAVNVAGYGLLYAAFLLDKVDGELARLRGATSARGILLDRVHHRVVEPTLFVAAGWHDFARRGDPVALIAGLATALLANIIEEHQQLAPYILLKHLGEGGTGGRPSPRVPSAWRRVRAALRPLKLFRTPITAMPLLFVCQSLEHLTGRAAIEGWLVAGATALAAYLAFQCVDYYAFRLDEELAGIEGRLGRPARRARSAGVAPDEPAAVPRRPRVPWVAASPRR